VTKRSVVMEITGTHAKVQAFERLVRPFGLIEMARTGEIAISRGRGEDLSSVRCRLALNGGTTAHRPTAARE
jgi:hypothetical protein